jgi:hypothetical protein
MLPLFTAHLDKHEDISKTLAVVAPDPGWLDKPSTAGGN